MVEVRVGGIRFEDWPDDYDNCFLISRNGLRNWRGGDVRREEVPRPAAHGAFDFRGYHAQQLPTLSGTLLASTPEVLQQMKDRVLGLLANGASGRMVVDDEKGSAWRDVRLLSCADPEDLDELSATFSLSFWAADPRLYGEVRVFPAGVPAIQRGNFEATPRLLVGAGSGGYTVTGPGGRQIVVGASAPAGSHYIDFAAGGLFTAAGVRVPGAMSVFQPWTVGPGLPGVVASITGARSLVQSVTDTYI